MCSLRGRKILGINWSIGFINLRKLLGGLVLDFAHYRLLRVCLGQVCCFERRISVQRMPPGQILVSNRRFGLRIMRGGNLRDFDGTAILHPLFRGKVLGDHGLIEFGKLRRLRRGHVYGRHWFVCLHELCRGQVCFKHRVKHLGGLWQLRHGHVRRQRGGELHDLRRGHLLCHRRRHLLRELRRRPILCDRCDCVFKLLGGNLRRHSRGRNNVHLVPRRHLHGEHWSKRMHQLCGGNLLDIDWFVGL